jgi:hypothetical protein
VLESPLCPAEDYPNRNVNTIVRVLENQYLFNKPFRENQNNADIIKYQNYTMPLAYVIANQLTNNGLLKFNPEKRIRYKAVTTTISTNNLLYGIDIETAIMENVRCDVISMYQNLGLITIPDAPLLICKKILNEHDEATIDINCLY